MLNYIEIYDVDDIDVIRYKNMIIRIIKIIKDSTVESDTAGE